MRVASFLRLVSPLSVASMHTAWNRMAESSRHRVPLGYLLPLYFFLLWEHLYRLGRLKVIFLKEVESLF